MSHKIRYHFSNAAFICLTKALWDNNIIDKVDDDFIFHIWFTCHIRAFIVRANLRWKRLGHWKDKSYKIWYWITFEHQRPSSTSFLPPWRIQIMKRLIFLYAALHFMRSYNDDISYNIHIQLKMNSIYNTREINITKRLYYYHLT